MSHQVAATHILDPDAYDLILAHLERTPLLAEIAVERNRLGAAREHPDGTGLAGKAVVAGARLACQAAAMNGELTWRHLLWREVAGAFEATDPGRLRASLIHVAALATAWAEDLDRRRHA